MTQQTFERNKVGFDYVVGDLHGCLELFHQKLDDMRFTKDKDRMFSVGDLIDRGANSLGCLKLLDEPWFHAVQGNHESEFLIPCVLGRESTKSWNFDGGDWAKSADQNSLIYYAIKASHLPYSIIVDTSDGKIAISHAAPPSFDWADAVDPTDSQVHQMLWDNDWLEEGFECEHPPVAKGVLRSYHGHTHVSEIETVGNAVFIDTAAFFTGRLTVVKIN